MEPDTREEVWILSIDGGGIRGLIPAMILRELEDKLKVRIADIFDVVAGTSTGSILSLGLTVSDEADNSRPKFSAGELVSLYENDYAEIFHPTFLSHIPFLNRFRTKYEADNFEKLLNEKFSHKRNVCSLKDIVKDKCVMAPAYDITGNKKVIFNNFFSDPNLDPDPDSYSIPDVVRASTAAPTYFPAKKISNRHYVDGCVYMNNPAYEAYLRAKNFFKAKEYVVCSLGTGIFEEKLDQLADDGQLFWLGPMITLMSNTSSELVASYFETEEKRDYSYYPIRPSLSKDIPLDGTGWIDALKDEAKEIIKGDDFNHLYTRIQQKIETTKKQSQN